jgi:heat shock protein HslJ
MSFNLRKMIKITAAIMFVVLAALASSPSPAKPFITAANGNVRLEDTTWNLTRLGPKDVVASENQRQPYIVLDSSNKRVTGSGGCNRLNGTYTLEKQNVHFGPIASTMMACPRGMEVEGTFLRTLDKVHSWKLHGNELELQDENGAFLLRFEAAPPEK